MKPCNVVQNWEIFLFFLDSKGAERNQIILLSEWCLSRSFSTLISQARYFQCQDLWGRIFKMTRHPCIRCRRFVTLYSLVLGKDWRCSVAQGQREQLNVPRWPGQTQAYQWRMQTELSLNSYLSFGITSLLYLFAGNCFIVLRLEMVLSDFSIF